MRESLRLSLRMHRFELIAIAIFGILVIAAAFVVAARLEAVGFGPCALASDTLPAGCDRLAQRFYEIDQNQANPVFGFIAILPYAAGLFLGAPLIAREIERGTTRLAWSIAPSRVRWYVARVVPIVVFVAVVTFAAGVAADRLAGARSPNLDIANAFDGFGTRGMLVALTALVMTAGAIGLGAVIGRVLPTIILALVIGALGINGVARLHAEATQREAVLVESEMVAPGDRYVDQLFRMPDGTLASWTDLEQLDPESLYSETGPTYPVVSFVIPGERYREIELREAAILGSIALVMLVGTGVIVRRRRPG